MGVDSSLPPIDIRFLSGELESWNYEYLGAIAPVIDLQSFFFFPFSPLHRRQCELISRRPSGSTKFIPGAQRETHGHLPHLWHMKASVSYISYC